MLALVGLIPSLWRWGLIISLVVAVMGLFTYERVELIHEGEQKERQEVEDANRIEQQKAEAGSTVVDGCYATGGTWDRANGVCDNPAR